MGGAESHCTSYDIELRPAQLVALAPQCDSCEVSDIGLTSRIRLCGNCEGCDTDSTSRIQAARAGFDALSAVGTASAGLVPAAQNLTPRERLAVECAIDQWCVALAAKEGLKVDVSGSVRRVRLVARPLALVADGLGTFPLAKMERVREPRDRHCVISFVTHAPVDGIASHGEVKNVTSDTFALHFSFPQRYQCMEFALSLRSLQVLAPAWDLNQRLFVPDGCESGRTSGGSARSSRSRSSVGNGGRRRRCSKIRQQKPLIQAVAFPRGVGHLANLSTSLPRLTSAELRDVVDKEEAPTPFDSPSARKLKMKQMKRLLTSDLPSNVAIPNLPASKRDHLADESGPVSVLFGRVNSKESPPEDAGVHPATPVGTRPLSLHASPGIALGTPGSTPRGGIADPTAVSRGNPVLGVSSEDEGLRSPINKESLSGDMDALALDLSSTEWRCLHQFRRARLATLIGPVVPSGAK
eukprot:TRINITY_DN28898_c0_g1_i1.p1 TRINITY_DN28898_c0_g1~~TRINITY_DN28898_c0_g1_i1.p1  ORF type:complete len:495 (+),score=43.71 TRINITY_DN28898_c0_g1_i1:83-1486(+)